MDALKVNDTYHILFDKAQSILENKEEVIDVIAKAEEKLKDIPEELADPNKMELMLQMAKA